MACYRDSFAFTLELLFNVSTVFDLPCIIAMKTAKDVGTGGRVAAVKVS
jgi:hypothetical protein